MNQQWTKNELIAIVAQLQMQKEPYFMYKRTMFFRATHAETDIVLEYIGQELLKSGGATSTMMRRSVFEQCAKTDSSPVLKWVLNNTDPSKNYFPVVSILTELLTHADESIAQFTIAHELGHFVHGHHESDLKLVDQGEALSLTPAEYEQRELAADAYAISLMGGSHGVVAGLNNLLRWVSVSDFESQGISPEVIKASTDVIHRRIKAAQCS